MASIFYNRYIPPSPVEYELLQDSRPRKKRKKIHANEDFSPKDTHEGEVEDYLSNATNTVITEASSRDVDSQKESVKLSDKSDDSRRKPKKSKREKNKRSSKANLSENATLEATEDLRQHVKHFSIRSKYEKVKLSAATTEMQKEEPSNVGVASPNDGFEAAKYGLEPLPQPAATEDRPKVSMEAALPKWIRDPTLVSTSDSIPFATLPLHEKLIKSLEKKAMSEAFAVQSGVLPLLLRGPKWYSGDLCVSAATGSGKTLAYALPMVQSLLGRGSGTLKGLVVVPTRELVAQVVKTFETLMSGTKFVVGSAVGSSPLKDEGHSLVLKTEKYDPAGWRLEQQKMNEPADLMNWDFDTVLEGHGDSRCSYNFVVDFKSKVDILVCTPGRLVEHIQSTKGFTLHHVEWLIIDEADRLLDESFQQWLDVVIPGLQYLPPLSPLEEQMQITFPINRQREIKKIILSATMTRDVGKLAGLRLKLPKFIVLEGGPSIEKQQASASQRMELPATLQEVAIPISTLDEKPLVILRLLEQVEKIPSNDNDSLSDGTSSSGSSSSSSSSMSSSSQDNSDSGSSTTSTMAEQKQTPSSPSLPQSTSKTYGTLIFTSNTESAHRLARLLALLRPSWSARLSTITKTSTTSSRKSLSAFRQRKLDILIATDRASRGLDIENLKDVINYDMPGSVNSYVHRVGRTARAGKKGTATTLVAHHEARWFWNEVARSKEIGRAEKVRRNEVKVDMDGKERTRYENALAMLGEETKRG